MSRITNYVSNGLKSFFWGDSEKTELSLSTKNLSQKEKRTLIAQIQETYSGRIKQDISTWRMALAMAENKENPRRNMLIRCYRDAMIDLHLTAVINNRKKSVLANNFYLVDKDGKPNEELTKLIRKPWFYTLLNHILDTSFVGTRLIEINPERKNSQFVRLDLVNPEYVVPEFGVVLKSIGDSYGIDYRNAEFASSVMEFGEPTNLGDLMKVMPMIIYKKNALACWAEFCEIFGLPIRIGKVASRDASEINKMGQFLQDMRKSAYAVIGEGDDIDLKESSRGDAFNVFDKLIDRVNSEMSKLILGQTMTTDNGSSKSQGEVHERVANDYYYADMQMIDFAINEVVIPVMIANGYKIEGHSFAWDIKENITQIELDKDQFIIQNFELENLSYFEKRYGVAIKGLKQNIDKNLNTPPSSGKNTFERISNLTTEVDNLYFKNCCDHD